MVASSRSIPPRAAIFGSFCWGCGRSIEKSIDCGFYHTIRNHMGVHGYSSPSRRLYPTRRLRSGPNPNPSIQRPSNRVSCLIDPGSGLSCGVSAELPSPSIDWAGLSLKLARPFRLQFEVSTATVAFGGVPFSLGTFWGSTFGRIYFSRPQLFDRFGCNYKALQAN